MGTRNLTIVKSKGKTKVAQYGQWDGYPTGQGQTIADFIKKVDIEKFKKSIDALGEYTEADIKKAYEEAGAKTNDEWISSEISEKKNRAHPALCRDHGAGILELIYNGEVSKVKLDEEFKEDGLFCEYYYIIDLDNETVTMNGGKPFTFKAWTRKGKMEQLENKTMRNNKGQFIDGTVGINTRFTSERMKGNQYAKGNPKNKTTFGVIDTRMEKHKQWKGGIQKTRDGFYIQYESKKRMPLGRWKWIQVYGEIPKGHVIIHLDWDKYNDDINNLDCISRVDNLKRNRRL